MKCLSCPNEAEADSNYCSFHKQEDLIRRLRSIEPSTTFQASTERVWASSKRASRPGLWFGAVALLVFGLALGAYMLLRDGEVPPPVAVLLREMVLANDMITSSTNITKDNYCWSSSVNKKGEVVYDFVAPSPGLYALRFDRRTKWEGLLTVELNGEKVEVVAPPDEFGWTWVTELWLTDGPNKLRLSFDRNISVCRPTLVQETPASLRSIDGGNSRRAGIIRLRNNYGILIVRSPAELERDGRYVLEFENIKLQVRIVPRVLGRPALGECEFRVEPQQR